MCGALGEVSEMRETFDAFQAILSIAAFVTALLTVVSGVFVWNILKKERERRSHRLRELQTALASRAEQVIVAVEYADGRRKELVKRPVPESRAVRHDLELALQHLEEVLSPGAASAEG
jgi:hypothetical protein